MFLTEEYLKCAKIDVPRGAININPALLGWGKLMPSHDMSSGFRLLISLFDLAL